MQKLIYVKFLEKTPFDNEKFFYEKDFIYKLEFHHGKLFVIKGFAAEVEETSEAHDDPRFVKIPEKKTRKKRTKKQ